MSKRLSPEQEKALVTRPRALTEEQEFVYSAFLQLAVSLYRAHGKALDIIDSDIDEEDGEVQRCPHASLKDHWPALRLEMDDGQVFELRVMRYFLGYFVQVLDQSTPFWMREEIRKRVAEDAMGDPARPGAVDDPDDATEDPDDDEAAPPVLPDCVLIPELPRQQGTPYWRG
jgi:hypothetical protein